MVSSQKLHLTLTAPPMNCSKIPRYGGEEAGSYSVAVKILCDSSGCDEVGGGLQKKQSMIAILCENDLNKDWF